MAVWIIESADLLLKVLLQDPEIVSAKVLKGLKQQFISPYSPQLQFRD
jgi:hypothetical protein